MNVPLDPNRKGSTLGILETDASSVDIQLECNNGHIALIEIEGLPSFFNAHPGSVVNAYRQSLMNDIGKTIESWHDASLISVKCGWVGKKLLLVGFPNLMADAVFRARIGTLISEMSKPKMLLVSENSGAGSQVQTSRMKVNFSYVTRPKLVGHTELSSILINRLQSQRMKQFRGAVEVSDGKPSARWSDASALSPGLNIDDHGDEETIANSFNEVTRQTIRQQIKDRRLDLRVTPTANPVTGSWISLSMRVNGLADDQRNNEIRNASMLGVICKEMGMEWELEVGAIYQALHEIQEVFNETPMGQHDFICPVKAGVSLQSAINLCYYPKDIESRLSEFERDVTRKLIIVINNMDDPDGLISASQIKRMGDWMTRLTDKYGITFMGHFTDLDNFDPKGMHKWLPIIGLAFSDTRNSDSLHGIIHAMMKQSKETSDTLPFTLDTTFSKSARKAASEIGAEFIEQEFAGEPNGLRLRTALPLSLNSSPGIPKNQAIIDARKRFRN